jgi:hypothetical protein
VLVTVPPVPVVVLAPTPVVLVVVLAPLAASTTTLPPHAAARCKRISAEPKETIRFTRAP